MRRLLVAITCWASACSGAKDSPPKESSPPAPAAGATAPAESCAGLFEPPAGGTKLCDEHVAAEGEEIHWTSWAVTASRMDAFKPYGDRGAACGASVVTKPPILAVSKGEMRVSVHDKGETGYPTCASTPGPGDQSVVLISTRRVK